MVNNNKQEIKDDEQEFDNNVSNWIANKKAKQKEINIKNIEYLKSVSIKTLDSDTGKLVLLVPEGICIGKGNNNINEEYNSSHIISIT